MFFSNFWRRIHVFPQLSSESALCRSNSPVMGPPKPKGCGEVDESSGSKKPTEPTSPTTNWRICRIYCGMNVFSTLPSMHETRCWKQRTISPSDVRFLCLFAGARQIFIGVRMAGCSGCGFPTTWGGGWMYQVMVKCYIHFGSIWILYSHLFKKPWFVTPKTPDEKQQQPDVPQTWSLLNWVQPGFYSRSIYLPPTVKWW